MTLLAEASPKLLRIAMIAPPYFTVPPDGYGGVEAIVADLVDELVTRGHHVTLVGAGDHGTKAQRFVSTTDRLPSNLLGQVLPEVAHAARAATLLEDVDVDVVHDHTCAGPLLARGLATRAPIAGCWPRSANRADPSFTSWPACRTSRDFIPACILPRTTRRSTTGGGSSSEGWDCHVLADEGALLRGVQLRIRLPMQHERVSDARQV